MKKEEDENKKKITDISSNIMNKISDYIDDLVQDNDLTLDERFLVIYAVGIKYNAGVWKIRKNMIGDKEEKFKEFIRHTVGCILHEMEKCGKDANER